MKHLLNPHLLSLGVLPDEPGESMIVPPHALLTSDRFGVTFKCIYASHYLAGGACQYPLLYYIKHLVAMTGGSLKEDDGSKHSLGDYRHSFEQLIESMRNGYDANHPIPVDRNMVALDGSHRIAAALVLGASVNVLKFSHEAPSYNSSLFSGMDCDHAAIEYCKRKPSARIMVLYDAAPAEPYLNGFRVVYSRAIKLESIEAQDNLITELYLGEEWLGKSENGFPGAAPKARGCFRRGLGARVLVVDGHNNAIVESKLRIRDIAGVGHDSVHATDTREETLRVARVLLNANSRAFLSRKRKHMPAFDSLIARYQTATAEYDQDLLCVDGSAVMGAYGLREPRDLDFVHACPVDVSEPISSHNAYSLQYPFSKDDLIFNPANYFWSRGVKYATLAMVRRVKEHIKDEKNARDLKLMEGVA